MRLALADIKDAAERIRGSIVETPCPASIPLSELTGCQVFCKMESLQRTGSFKERGARNALMTLDPAAQARGVIAASAGNHALALAYHGKLLGIPVTVVMPRFAPLTKVENCRRLGATIYLDGADLHEARGKAGELAERDGLTYINGFDHPAVIAGAGTLGLEILHQVPGLEAVVVPTGGAGLLAGVAVAIKSLQPSVIVIGVEPERCASFSAAVREGSPLPVAGQPTLADGLAVTTVGRNGYDIAKGLVDKMVTVSEQDLALSVLRLIELEKSVVEGAGAAGLAACLAGHLPELRGKKVVLPLTGGNIDSSTLGRVLERGLAHEGRLHRFSATISDRPGGLARFAAILAEEGASVFEINHDRAFACEDINQVRVDCVVETRDHAHIRSLADRLGREGFSSL